MLISTAGISSLYDMYKQTAFTSFTQVNQPFITEEMWQKYWTIYKGTYNYMQSGRAGEPFWKNLTIRCLRLMDYIGYYMVGEFDCHEDEYLLEIWPILIKSWYFGKVWVIKSEEVRDLEIALAESEMYKGKVPENKLYRDNPFRLFEQQGEREGKLLFKSLLTGIDHIELDPKEMIYLSLNDGLNFMEWWRIHIEFVSGRSRVIDSLKALNKTVHVVVKNQNTYNNERSQIENSNVFYELHREAGTQGSGPTEQNAYQYMPITDGQRVKDMLDIVQQIYERDCEFMGVTLNSNEKKERLTAAENYKDLRRITNIQDWQLKNLKMFEARLKRKGWVEDSFKIEISGLAFAQGIPDVVQAQRNGTASSFGMGPKPIQEENE